MRTTVILLLMAVTTAMVWMYVRAQNERRQVETMERRLKDLEKRFLELKKKQMPPLSQLMTTGDDHGPARTAEINELTRRVEEETKKREFRWVGGPPLKRPGDCVLPQPEHKGTVLAVDAETGECVISLGAEDGVKKGFCYIISRDDEYVGTIQITDVQAKQSSGTPIEDISKDDIRRGDQAMNGA